MFILIAFCIVLTSHFGFAIVDDTNANNGETRTISNIAVVKLLDSSGNGLEGGIVKYYLNGWKEMGQTDEYGMISIQLPEGTTNLQVQMQYLGMKKILNQNITENEEFIFETVDTVVKLEDSNGNGLEGGEVIYSSWSWNDFGTTDASGEIHRELLPGQYNFRMKYEGGKLDLKQNTQDDNTVIFKTVDTVVKLEDSNGNGLEGAEVIYSNWTWKDFGITDQNGEIHKELLENNYNFQMKYEGGKVIKKQDIANDSIVVFKTKNTVVRLEDSNGNGLEGAEVIYSNWTWKDFGTTNQNGEINKELLENTYNFRVKYNGKNQDKRQDISTDSTIVFVEEGVVQEKYKLTLNIEPNQAGAVRLIPNKASYDKNEEVEIVVISAVGYEFKQWSGKNFDDVVDNHIIMDENKEITAVFEEVSSGNEDEIIVSTVAELMATEYSTKKGNVTVLIKDGIYEMPKGLWLTGSNITYKSLSGNRDNVILKGNFKTSHIFWITNDNVTIQDLTIGEVNNHGIQVLAEKDADNAVIRNVRFYDIKEQFIKGSKSLDGLYSDDCIVEDCLFEFTNGEAFQYYTGGIDVHTGKNWIVRNNTFKNIQRVSGTLTEGAIHFWGESRDSLIEGNIIINCDRGIMLGLDSSYHYGGIVKNNFIKTTRDVGIYLCNATDAKIYNNTIWSQENYPNSIEYRFDTTGTEVINNITNKEIQARNGGVVNLENNIKNADETWFVNLQEGDLHLAKNILSIVDKGSELVEVDIDIDGETRDINKIDIGADEITQSEEKIIVGIELLASKLNIDANGKDYSKLTLNAIYDDGSNSEISADSYICTVDGQNVEIKNNIFKSYLGGIYKIQAKAGDFLSNEITVEARELNLQEYKVKNLEVKHRDGQTFVTWEEACPLISDESIQVVDYINALRNYPKEVLYNIYESQSQITSVDGLTPIANVKNLSSWDLGYYNITVNSPDYVIRPHENKELRRFVIEEGQSPLEPGTGLFVTNPKESGQKYYAITVSVNGNEYKEIDEQNSTVNSIKEEVGQGSPILQFSETKTFNYVNNAQLNYYTRWETTPNSSVDSIAMDYLVAIPQNYKAPAPVGIHLHCWGGNLNSGYGWWTDANDGAILLSTNQYPYDWWTGYHEKMFTNQPLKTREDWESGVVRPYTSTRIISFLDWLKDNEQWDIDMNRTFSAGTSMGGSGSLMMAIRYPELISWSRSWVGVHIPSESPNFRSSYEGVYGKVEYDVLFEDGTPVWDYYNDDWYLRNYPNKEIGFLTFSNGKNDSGIGWGQAQKFYKALQDTKRPHMFVWGQGGHSQRAKMPITFKEKDMPIDIKLNQSLPAFTRCSLDDNPGNGDPSDGDLEGQVNAYLYWETDDLVDTDNKWEMTVAITQKAPQDSCKVDITPRRLQSLNSNAGDSYTWSNIDLSTGMVIESGEVLADDNGLITIEQITVSKNKNRVVIEK
ncbi:right-handed parallel beta-helix repeat-containing protein [Peptostreptococcaceae bacterium AGR-M142]